MTTVTQIIIDAYRASNLLSIGATPTDPQMAEGLRYLSRIVQSTLGNEAGEAFVNIAIGSDNIERPAGYPWYDTVPDGTDWYLHENYRMMLNLDQPVTIYLHPNPDEGARFSFIDMGNTLATNNLTIKGNGRRIDGDESVVFSTDGEAGEWFYRGDTGNWVKYAALELENEFPFPEAFDDYFILMLAMRLNPSYGAMIDGQSSEMLRRSKGQLRARYSVNIQTPSELGLRRMSDMIAGYRNRRYNDYVDPNAAFIRGRPY